MNLYNDPSIKVNGMILKKEDKFPRFKVNKKRIFLFSPKSPPYFDYELGKNLRVVIFNNKLIKEEFPKHEGYYGKGVYQVLEGEVFFIEYDYNEDLTIDIKVAQLKKGESVETSKYHTFYNISNKKSIVAYINKNLKENEELEKYVGHPYYITKGGIEQNSNYLIRNTRKLKKSKVNVLDLYFSNLNK